MHTDIHQVLTDKIVAALERKDIVSWTAPWHRVGGGLPSNALTRKPYHGVNVLALWIAAAEHGFAEPRWATFQQWRALGAQVRRGETGTAIVFWKEIEVAEPQDASDDSPGRRLVARASFVFNIAQVTDAPRASQPERSFAPYEAAERLLTDSRVPIEFTGDQPCYIPSRDLVRLPPRDRFISRNGFYATAAHELAHATGHPSRLDRDLSGRFGSAAYAMEELVAELASAFIYGRRGTLP
jgi:antirestriction protein ArdC